MAASRTVSGTDASAPGGKQDELRDDAGEQAVATARTHRMISESSSSPREPERRAMRQTSLGRKPTRISSR